MSQHSNAKNELIEIASNLFAKKGYNATGLSEIISESGITKGGLYYHFPGGKEELAIEALRYSESKIVEHLQTIISSNENPYEAIAANYRNMADEIDQNKTLQDMSIGLIALETYGSNDKIREVCDHIFNHIKKIYYDSFIRYGYDEKRAEEMSEMVYAMTEGGLLISLTSGGGKALRTLADKIIKLAD